MIIANLPADGANESVKAIIFTLLIEIAPIGLEINFPIMDYSSSSVFDQWFHLIVSIVRPAYACSMLI